MKRMGYEYQILHFTLFTSILILLFSPRGMMVSELEYNGNGNGNQIHKVSGVDEVEEKRAMILEKVRLLLGMGSFKSKVRSPTKVQGFLAPSPAPSIASEVPAPSPRPMAHLHLHSHSPRSRSRPRPTPLHHDSETGQQRDKARVRKIVIAVAVSGGVAFVISALGFIFLCGKFGRCRKRRTKYLSSTNKVSFDLGPEHFYLNSLEAASVSDGSCLKHVNDNVNNSSDKKLLGASLDEKNETSKESYKHVSEELSVNEVEEPKHCDSDESKCSLVNKIVTVECSFSSDDESFHSICNSPSSNGRSSNASEGEGDQSDTVEVCSQAGHNFTPPVLFSSKNSPTTNPCDPKQNTSVSMPPSISPQYVPPPPPPPPPPLHGRTSFSQISSRSTLITSHSSTLSNLSSQNSDSSSGSNSTTKHEFLSSPKKALPSPPTGAKGIPPPPPHLPPPILKGHSNGLHPPPPPPGLVSQVTPVGKDGSPLPKLKPLHWDKVRAAPDRSMVWDKMKSSSFEFDEKMIESLFGYNFVGKNDEGKSKTPSPTKHILEPKRLQNITILSKALNATPEQVCHALVQGEGLLLQQLEALVKMVPTKEEETNLSKYEGDINELGSAEKFVKAMLNVPFAFVRVEAMLYRDTFEDEVIHLRKSFAVLEEACKELRSSRLFLKLLEAVLKTGNRMNVGTIRGGAIAFKLDALLKLADVKGTDGKTTLLHFVVQEIIRSEGIRESEIFIKKNNQKTNNKTAVEREEDYRRMGLNLVSGLSSELCNVKKTATIDLDVLASSVSTLSDGMVKLRHLVYEDLSIDKNKNFVHTMRCFLTYAEKNIKELQKDEDRVLLHVREITEYFHGHVSKDEVNPLRIFVIVRDFLGMLDQVCKEVRTMKLPTVPNSGTPF